MNYEITTTDISGHCSERRTYGVLFAHFLLLMAIISHIRAALSNPGESVLSILQTVNLVMQGLSIVTGLDYWND